MSVNAPQINDVVQDTLLLDAVGRGVEDAPQGSTNSGLASVEEGINYVASVYPSENPVVKHIQDNLLDDVGRISGVDVANDADRLKILEDLQQKILMNGADNLDPALLDYLNHRGGEVIVVETVHRMDEDGSWVLVAASVNGQSLDVEALQQDRPEGLDIVDHILDKFFDGSLPEEVGQANGGAIPDKLSANTKNEFAPEPNVPHMYSSPQEPSSSPY